MSDLLLQIAALTEQRGRLYAKLSWSEGDRAQLYDLNCEIDRLWRLRRAELAKLPPESVPLGDFAVDRPLGWANRWGRGRYEP